MQLMDNIAMVGNTTIELKDQAHMWMHFGGFSC